MKKVWLKIITLILVLSALGLGLWLINKNIPIYGNLVVEMKLGQDQPMISKLGPEPRVKLENDYQIILESPVYFDLRTLPWFKQARIYFAYQENGAELEGIGGQTGSGWSYDLKEPLVIMDYEEDLPIGEASWQKAVFDIDLTKVYSQKNVRRFLISTKQAGEEGKLKIKALKIILSR